MHPLFNPAGLTNQNSCDSRGIFFSSNVWSARQILLRLSALVRDPLVAGKTLILFDEVQECPEVVTQIEFLVDEGSCRYALSGSLLGVELKDLRSEPVGYMDVVDVFPFDLEKFCKVIGVADKVINELRKIIALR